MPRTTLLAAMRAGRNSLYAEMMHRSRERQRLADMEIDRLNSARSYDALRETALREELAKVTADLARTTAERDELHAALAARLVADGPAVPGTDEVAA